MSVHEAATADAVPASPAAPQPEDRSPVPAWLRPPLLLATLLILALGAMEDLYGNTDSGDVYGSDAVQYLDIARTMARHDWHSALNPLWSQAYPALLAVVRPLLPAGPGGDWWMTRSVNFVIFAASYAAFLYLLFTLVPTVAASTRSEQQRWLRRIGACLLLFVPAQICLGQVSRVNPDELVTTLFLLACAQLVRLPSVRSAGGHPGDLSPRRCRGRVRQRQAAGARRPRVAPAERHATVDGASR